MNTYEIFTDVYSTIIQADSLIEAVNTFNAERNNVYLSIAAIQVNHPIFKELMK